MPRWKIRNNLRIRIIKNDNLTKQNYPQENEKTRSRINGSWNKHGRRASLKYENI